MKTIRDVNKSLFIGAMLWLWIFPILSWANPTKTNPYIIVKSPVVPSELTPHLESIKQIIIRAVLITQKFEIIFSDESQFKDTKLRIYNLQTQISRSEKSGFYSINMELINPKIDKVIRFARLDMVSGKRLLYTIRLMVLQIIFGEKFNEKVGKLEEVKELDINAPDEAKKPAFPQVKPVEALPEKKASPIQEVEEKSKKKPQEQAKAKNDLGLTYLVGASYQLQSVESSGNLEDTQSEVSSLALDFNLMKKVKNLNRDKWIFSWRYSYPISESYEETPTNWQLSGLYHRDVASGLGIFGGLILDRTHFFNRPGLGDEVKAATLTANFVALGSDYSTKLLNRTTSLSLSLFKSVFTMIDFPGKSSSDLSSYGYSFFFSIQAVKNYFIGLRFTSFAYSLSGSSPFANKDERVSLGIFYPVGQ